MRKRMMALALAAWAIWGCGGENEGTMSGLKRALKGTLLHACTNCLRPAQDVDVPSTADTVMVTDTSGQSVTYPVDGEGHFEAELEQERSYVVSFLDSQQDIFVGSLTFQTSGGQESRTIPPGEQDIDLGLCSLLDGRVTPANNPLETTDADSDGVSDFVDGDYHPQPRDDLEGYYEWHGYKDLKMEWHSLGQGTYIAYLEPEMYSCIFAAAMYVESSGDLLTGLGYQEVSDGVQCAWAQLIYWQGTLDAQGNLSGDYWWWSYYNTPECGENDVGYDAFSAERTGEIHVCP